MDDQTLDARIEALDHHLVRLTAEANALLDALVRRAAERGNDGFDATSFSMLAVLFNVRRLHCALELAMAVAPESDLRRLRTEAARLGKRAA